ncbi:MAG: FMN-binding protein [Clostridia bacterium]|nr:FMN-binding protein [Clostridia bacterium]
MRDILKLGLKLLVIAAVAGLALGGVYAVTKEPIAEQERLAQVRSRQAVLPEAQDFVETEEGSGIYVGLSAEGETVGFCTSVITSGYANEIEVTVGVDTEGVITGVSVGGTNFQETAGLGARTKEEAFTDQYRGLTGDIALSKDGGSIDAIASATTSSRAVTNAVDAAQKLLLEVIEGGAY